MRAPFPSPEYGDLRLRKGLELWASRQRLDSLPLLGTVLKPRWCISGNAYKNEYNTHCDTDQTNTGKDNRL